MLVHGERRPEGWRVVVRLAVPDAALSPAEARALAAEIADYADTVEFGWGNGPARAARGHFPFRDHAPLEEGEEPA